MLINTNTNVRITEYDFKAVHSNTSFPELLTDSILFEFNHAVLHYPNQPAVNFTQKIVDSGQELIDGKWWVIFTVTQNTHAEIMLAMQHAAEANEQSIQDVMDAKAQERGYKNIKAACAYASATSLVPPTSPSFTTCERFRMEGNALQSWMAETWATAYAYLATVQAGLNPMPTTSEAIALMPHFSWPV